MAHKADKPSFLSIVGFILTSVGKFALSIVINSLKQMTKEEKRFAEFRKAELDSLKPLRGMYDDENIF